MNDIYSRFSALLDSGMGETALFIPDSFDDIAALDAGESALLKLQISSNTDLKLRQYNQHANTRNVLVLGGNGFVGIHLIDRLVKDHRVNKVYAVVRAAGEESPEKRIKKVRGDYSLMWDENAADKLVCLEGSAIGPRFGLSPETFALLAHEVDSVFQCASESDYATPYIEIRPYWVESLWRVIEFCLTDTIKYLTYMGSCITHVYRSEADFKRPNSWWYSGYAQMKWVNQTTLRLLTEDHGLPITVAECPYVLGSTTVGIDRGMEYSFWRMLEIAYGMGLVWDLEGIGFVPVDLLSDMLVANLFSPMRKSLLAPRTPANYHNDIFAELLDCELIDCHQFWLQGHTQYSAHRIGTMFPEDFPETVRKTNVSPIFPMDYDTGQFPETRDLFKLYFDNLKFRDVRRGGHRHSGRGLVEVGSQGTTTA